jgi:hypothetical protein
MKNRENGRKGSIAREPVGLKPVLSPNVVAALQDLLRLHEAGERSGTPLLTRAGDVFLRRELLRGAGSLKSENRGSRRMLGELCLPSWDGCRLWLGAAIVKEFDHQPAPHQRSLLIAMQRAGWPRQPVDDPLGFGAERVTAHARKCLHETVKNVNNGLPRGTIRFRVDESGQRVTWEWAPRTAKPS